MNHCQGFNCMPPQLLHSWLPWCALATSRTSLLKWIHICPHLAKSELCQYKVLNVTHVDEIQEQTDFWAWRRGRTQLMTSEGATRCWSSPVRQDGVKVMPFCDIPQNSGPINPEKDRNSLNQRLTTTVQLSPMPDTEQFSSFNVLAEDITRSSHKANEEQVTLLAAHHQRAEGENLRLS